jgi:hypothetical protein
MVVFAETPLTALRPIHSRHRPLSVLNGPLVHTGHNTHDGGSARAGQTLGSACPANMGGGRTVGV